VVRYLVVEPGHWLSKREVLISPIAVEQSDQTDKVLRVALSRDQVRQSPDVDTQRPVSRQQELDNLAYFGYPAYWDSGALCGEVVLLRMLRTGPAQAEESNTWLATTTLAVSHPDCRAAQLPTCRCGRPRSNQHPRCRPCPDVDGGFTG
jgi:hypothetical protein